MRRFATIVVLFCFVFQGFSGEPETGKVADLITGGLFRNEDEIADFSGDLTEAERNALYEAHKKKSLLPAVANATIGFGLGSFAQGDFGGGIISAGSDLVGIWLFVAGFLIYGLNMAVIYGQEPAGNVPSADWFIWLGNAGTVLMAGSRIFGGIRAAWYMERYNRTLKGALGVNPAN